MELWLNFRKSVGFLLLLGLLRILIITVVLQPAATEDVGVLICLLQSLAFTQTLMLLVAPLYFPITLDRISVKKQFGRHSLGCKAVITDLRTCLESALKKFTDYGISYDQISYININNINASVL